MLQFEKKFCGRRAAAVKACASLVVFVTPPGLARYRYCGRDSALVSLPLPPGGVPPQSERAPAWWYSLHLLGSLGIVLAEEWASYFGRRAYKRNSHPLPAPKRARMGPPGYATSLVSFLRKSGQPFCQCANGGGRRVAGGQLPLTIRTGLAEVVTDPSCARYRSCGGVGKPF